MEIRPTRRARPGRSKTCKLTTTYDTFTDAVAAKVKVKRG